MSREEGVGGRGRRTRRREGNCVGVLELNLVVVFFHNSVSSSFTRYGAPVALLLDPIQLPPGLSAPSRADATPDDERSERRNNDAERAQHPPRTVQRTGYSPQGEIRPDARAEGGIAIYCFQDLAIRPLPRFSGCVLQLAIQGEAMRRIGDRSGVVAMENETATNLAPSRPATLPSRPLSNQR